MEEWENQFFVGVEPTTHNLNDYCSTTELEKRSNSFYDYLFIAGRTGFEPVWKFPEWQSGSHPKAAPRPIIKSFTDNS